MRRIFDTEVETLLNGEARSRLPLARQLLLYLDPFALFKDASQGPAPAREHALSYNRAMRWMLVPYIRRWMVIAVALAMTMALPSSLPAQWPPYPSAGVPRTTDGKPDLSAPAPRTADGKPDLSGVWNYAGILGFRGRPPDPPPGTPPENRK